jgi:hypothetical protein
MDRQEAGQLLTAKLAEYRKCPMPNSQPRSVTTITSKYWVSPTLNIKSRCSSCGITSLAVTCGYLTPHLSSYNASLSTCELGQTGT